ncbi:MAG: OmpH family outer membrane protein [Alistipes sp.]
MKKIFFIALLAITALSACKEKSTATEVAAKQNVGSSDIAYVEVETVLSKSDLFLNEGKALQEKTEKAQQSWGKKEQGLQYEAAQLQEKYQKGLMTSADAQANQQNIERRAAAYQAGAQKEAQVLDEENFVFTNKAKDLLQRAVKEVNADKKYKLIINASALIDADSTLNITPIILEVANKLYAADKTAKPKAAEKAAKPEQK